MEVGKAIRNLRTESGMSQEELAAKVFVSRQTISNWENDKFYPDVQSLSLIADVFGTSIDDLVKGDLPMIDARVAEEDARVAEQDVQDFKRNTAISSVLVLISLAVAGVAFDQGNWLALAMCAVVYAVALYFAFLIEGTKKRYDVQTYREIRAFMDGKPLEEIKAQRKPMPLGASIAGKMLFGACIGVAVALLMVGLARLL